MMAIAAWADEFAGVVERIGPRFARSEARAHAAAYLRGLLGRVERKNSWHLAEAAGDASPYGLQQFLYRAAWDPDAVRDDLRDYVGNAGSFFDTPGEIVGALRAPPSEAVRNAGFEWAEQFDYRRHLHILTDLWR